MISEQGFYRYDDGELLFAANQVLFPDGDILSKTNPPSRLTRGWKWCDTEAEARTYWNVPDKPLL